MRRLVQSGLLIALLLVAQVASAAAALPCCAPGAMAADVAVAPVDRPGEAMAGMAHCHDDDAAMDAASAVSATAMAMPCAGDDCVLQAAVPPAMDEAAPATTVTAAMTPLQLAFDLPSGSLAVPVQSQLLQDSRTHTFAPLRI